MLTLVWESRYRLMGYCGPGMGRVRSGYVMLATPINHHSAVMTEVIKTTGSTATACPASRHSPEADGMAAFPGLGVSAPAVRARSLAIRHRSRPADHRALPLSTSSKPARAVNGAVSRYSDSTSVRRPVRKRTLAPRRHQPRAAEGRDSVT